MGNAVIALLAVLAACLVLGAVWKWRQGRFRRSARAEASLPVGLGFELGSRATLVQFSSAFCAPCRATRVVLADVAASVPGVRHVEVDAESHLDLVRSWGILKTPTTLVLDGDGREVRRAAGAPRKSDVLAALP